MAKLTTKTRKALPKSSFAEPDKRAFPLTNASHDRAAISGATRSQNAGNISAAEADKIKAQARAKLAKAKKK